MDFIPRAVFFDLVGTLIRGRRPIGDQYAEELRRFGVEADPARLDLAFLQAMRTAPAMAFPGRTVSEAAELERQWWRLLVRQVTDVAGLGHRLEGTAFDRVFAALYDRFTTDRAWELYPDVVPALSGLRGRGLALGLITNYDSRVFQVLEVLGLAPLLDSVTIPAHVGAAKPDPAIFRHAVSGLGLVPGDALHVGDELEDDYRGAEAAGMRAVLLDRSGRQAGAPSVRRIESLADVLRRPGSPGGTR
jgi:putative hydrolase of the HAD superfamily